jgi:RecG-like helicase
MGFGIKSKSSMKNKSKNTTELETIPGVGNKTAEDLQVLGIRSIKDLKGKNPEMLYDRLCQQAGTKIDRCVLYVFRCAVYYASHKKHNPKLLLWWNWKDSIAIK